MLAGVPAQQPPTVPLVLVAFRWPYTPALAAVLNDRIGVVPYGLSSAPHTADDLVSAVQVHGARAILGLFLNEEDAAVAQGVAARVGLPFAYSNPTSAALDAAFAQIGGALQRAAVD